MTIGKLPKLNSYKFWMNVGKKIKNIYEFSEVDINLFEICFMRLIKWKNLVGRLYLHHSNCHIQIQTRTLKF